LPDQAGSGGGHCLYVCGLTQARGKWWLTAMNSWGKTWGVNGLCHMPESYFRDTDAFAVEADAEDPQEPNTPP
jgi:hypothetical protein